jgi:hypothetical protein
MLNHRLLPPRAWIFRSALASAEAVDVRWNIPNTRAATTELGDMLICDL